MSLNILSSPEQATTVTLKPRTQQSPQHPPMKWVTCLHSQSTSSTYTNARLQEWELGKGCSTRNCLTMLPNRYNLRSFTPIRSHLTTNTDRSYSTAKQLQASLHSKVNGAAIAIVENEINSVHLLQLNQQPESQHEESDKIYLYSQQSRKCFEPPGETGPHHMFPCRMLVSDRQCMASITCRCTHLTFLLGVHNQHRPTRAFSSLTLPLLTRALVQPSDHDHNSQGTSIRELSSQAQPARDWQLVPQMNSLVLYTPILQANVYLSTFSTWSPICQSAS